ncbi:MAG: DNA repair exonuclease [Gammaproteobacteria bacterium]|nr:MAG: DNA repair exonuclease [Gammaproteobacteria bacterium]
MSLVRFVHAADIHLDSPLKGLEKYESAPVEKIREATREAFKNLIAFCLDEQVDLLLISGDLFDGDLKDFKAGLFLTSQLKRLSNANILTVIIRGNHDAEAKMTKKLHWPDLVHELNVKKPETITFKALNIAVHGQGYAERDIYEDLSQHYPAAIAGMFNIGLLHTALQGRDGHAAYAPTSVEKLRAKGYDYWALGHVHQREVVDTNPYIVFPGNIQGRHAKELGPKGVTLVALEDSHVESVTEHFLDVVRWDHCQIDLAEACNEGDVYHAIRKAVSAAEDRAEGRLLACRLTLCGATELHADLVSRQDDWSYGIRAKMTDSDGDLWIEKIRFKTQAKVDIGQLRTQDNPLGGVLRTLEQLQADDAGRGELLDTLNTVNNKLPRRYKQWADALNLDDKAQFDELLEGIEQLIIPKLLQEGGES